MTDIGNAAGKVTKVGMPYFAHLQVTLPQLVKELFNRDSCCMLQAIGGAIGLQTAFFAAIAGLAVGDQAGMLDGTADHARTMVNGAVDDYGRTQVTVQGQIDGVGNLGLEPQLGGGSGLGVMDKNTGEGKVGAEFLQRQPRTLQNLSIGDGPAVCRNQSLKGDADSKDLGSRVGKCLNKGIRRLADLLKIGGVIDIGEVQDGFVKDGSIEINGNDIDKFLE